MKFLIISHVLHTVKNEKIYGYGPYIKEMNLWLKYVDEVRIVAPMLNVDPDPIDLAYEHTNIIFNKVPSFNLLTYTSKIKTFILLPYIFMTIVFAMFRSDHIHLRCPGNMGLLGAIAQIFFPWKIKTVKYAGNWDPNSRQPRSYRLQKNILSSTKLSKNIQVLVYGKWPNQTKNIKEFFTATYSEVDIKEVSPRSLVNEIKLVFVGALSSGKQPMIAVKAAHTLIQNGLQVRLDIMGEGPERKELELYIAENFLQNSIVLHGNQNSQFVQDKLTKANFLILMSKSEGWPKVVAEAMFWGAVPIASNVSCVNYMIGYGSRGTLVNDDSDSVVEVIQTYRDNTDRYEKTSIEAIQWSRKFTLESFDTAIKGLLDG